MIKIFITDDHPLIREGIRNILREDPDMDVVGEAGNAFEVQKLIKSQQVDILLLDLSMPDKNGLELLKDLKYTHPNLPVLILSMYSEDQFAIRALKGGASGYITKESATDELIKAIRKIIAGHKYISAELAEKLAAELVSGNKEPHETLSDREFQVFRYIASGKRVCEISKELSLSERTIHTYRARIFQKMNMNSEAQLIHYAIQKDLIDKQKLP